MMKMNVHHQQNYSCSFYVLSLLRFSFGSHFHCSFVVVVDLLLFDDDAVFLHLLFPLLLDAVLLIYVRICQVLCRDRKNLLFLEIAAVVVVV